VRKSNQKFSILTPFSFCCRETYLDGNFPQQLALLGTLHVFGKYVGNFLACVGRKDQEAKSCAAAAAGVFEKGSLRRFKVTQIKSIFYLAKRHFRESRGFSSPRKKCSLATLYECLLKVGTGS
jgi:hypothetical protein